MLADEPPANTPESRARFLAFTSEPWATFRLLSNWEVEDGSAEEEIGRLADEARILDLITSYAYSHDAKDVEWTLQKFSVDDDPVTSMDGMPRRQWLANLYTIFNQDTHNFSRHRITNLLIRQLAGGDEAWLTGYWHVSRSFYTGEAASRYGHYFWRVVREDDEWRITDRRGSGAEGFESLYADERLQDDRPSGESRMAAVQLPEDLIASRPWLLEAGRSDGSDDAKLTRLRVERAARELLARYAYAFDSHDLAWIASLFTADAAIRLAGQRYQGSAGVIEAFGAWMANIAKSQHRYSNLVVKLAPAGDEALLTAAIHVDAVSPDDSRSAQFGSYAGVLRLTNGGWRIAYWRIEMGAPLSLQAIPLHPVNSARLMSARPNGREQFDAITTGLWSAFKWLTDMPLPDDDSVARLRRLTDELDVRDLLTTFIGAVDVRDPTAATACFTDDGVITLSGGRFIGHERVRSYLDSLLRGSPSTHRIMNIAVRITADGDEAWLSSYVFAITPDRLSALDGRYFGRAVKGLGRWKLADLLITSDRTRRYLPSMKGN